MQCRLPSAIVAAALAVSFSAHAEEGVTLIARGGIRAAIEKLVPESERKTGLQVKATFSGLGTKQQVARGDAFDVPIVQPPFPEVLASGNVLANSAVTLASVSVGVAVRQGAPKPDISTADAVKRTLIAAKSASFPNPAGGAAAGVSFVETLKKLGIAEQIEPRLKRAQGGANAMKMGIDQTWDDSATLKIDYTGRRAPEFPDVGGFSDGQNLTVTNG